MAKFLLRVAEEFGLMGRVGVMRTDGARNCVSAGSVLARAAGRMVPLDQSLITSYVAPAEQPDIIELEAPLATAVPFCLSKEELDSDSDDGGTGMDLDDVGSGDEEGVVRSSPSPSTAADSDSAADAAADVFCVLMQSELDELVGGDAHESSFPWQRGRCATHTLQLSVRAGLAVKPVRDLLDKVRLVAKLCRTSTNFQRQLELSVAAESRAAEHSGSVRTTTVHRLLLDCPTRWGSTLVTVERYLRVASAVPAALSAYYYQASTGKKKVEALNLQQQLSMREAVSFLGVLENASAGLGSELSVTAPLKEIVYWHTRRTDEVTNDDCDAVAKLKRAVLRSMLDRRTAEKLSGTNKD
jgi:hypothetical protein